MNKFLIFENAGELDLRFLSMFGCSVKTGSDNPIGWFGTGLKFATAVLLRTGHRVLFQIGEQDAHWVETVTQTIREKNFECVHIGGQSAGFTTELGKGWEVWMAYRELYCNAKDEPDARIYKADAVPAPTAGVTRIIVEGETIQQTHRTRSEFILEDLTPDHQLGEAFAVYNRPSTSLFYKGIKVGDLQRPALCTYNKLTFMDLTEDRTVKSIGTEQYEIARNMLEFAPVVLLEQVLIADDKALEHYLDYHGWGTTVSEQFFPTVARLQADRLTKMNQSALRLWHEKGRGRLQPTPIEPTPVQAKLLAKAVALCVKLGFAVEQYPVLLVETLGEESTLAMADMLDKQIFLTVRLLQQGGVKHVCRALIEEYLHLKFSYKDCSRELQNYLFDKVLSLAEELHGEPL